MWTRLPDVVYLAETLEEVLLSALDAAVEVATLTATEQLDQVLGFHVQQLVKVDTAEGVLLEGALLLDLDFVRHGQKAFVSEFLKQMVPSLGEQNQNL